MGVGGTRWEGLGRFRVRLPLRCAQGGFPLDAEKSVYDWQKIFGCPAGTRGSWWLQEESWTERLGRVGEIFSRGFMTRVA